MTHNVCVNCCRSLMLWQICQRNFLNIACIQSSDNTLNAKSVWLSLNNPSWWRLAVTSCLGATVVTRLQRKKISDAHCAEVMYPLSIYEDLTASWRSSRSLTMMIVKLSDICSTVIFSCHHHEWTNYLNHFHIYLLPLFCIICCHLIIIFVYLL